jgi:hypothetical protein
MQHILRSGGPLVEHALCSETTTINSQGATTIDFRLSSKGVLERNNPLYNEILSSVIQ